MDAQIRDVSRAVPDLTDRNGVREHRAGVRTSTRRLSYSRGASFASTSRTLTRPMSGAQLDACRAAITAASEHNGREAMLAPFHRLRTVSLHPNLEAEATDDDFMAAPQVFRSRSIRSTMSRKDRRRRCCSSTACRCRRDCQAFCNDATVWRSHRLSSATAWRARCASVGSTSFNPAHPACRHDRP